MARSKTRLKTKARAAKAKRPARAARPKKVAKKARPAKRVKRVPERVSSKLARALSRAEARAEVEGLLARLPPPVAPIVKALRQLVREVAPEAVERVEGQVPSYFAGGMFARIEPKEREVLFTFLRGGQLPSAAALRPEGEAGSVTLSSPDAVRTSVLRALVREAVLLNLGKSGVRAQG